MFHIKRYKSEFKGVRSSGKLFEYSESTRNSLHCGLPKFNVDENEYAS